MTGANGAVGQAILRCAAAPIEVVAAVRSERAAAALGSALGAGARVSRVSYADPVSLDAALEGAGAVIHLAGILVERPGSRYEDAHVETTRSLAAAAKRAGLARLVLVSAIGADPASANRYWATKGEAEAVVRASGLAHAVLRVPLLLGRGTEGAATLARRLERGAATLIGGGRTLQQPLAVDDLARAALRACEAGVAAERTLDLAGPQALPEREILERAARLSGRRVRIRSVPPRLVRLALMLRQRLARPGFSTDALEVITTDTRLDPAPAAAALGIALTGIDDMIRQSLEPGPRP